MSKPDGSGAIFEAALEKSRQHRKDLSDVNSKLKELVESLKSNKKSIDNRGRPAAPAEPAAPGEGSDPTLRARLVDIERENRRLFEQFAALEDQSYRLTGLYVALQRLHQSSDRREVLKAIEEVVVNILGSEQLAIFLELDPKAARLTLAHSMGVDPARWLEVPVGQGTIGKVAAEGKPHVKGSAGAEERDLTACIPLLSGARVIGVLAVFELLAHKPLLGQFDLDLLEALSVHAGSALRLATLEQHSGEGVSLVYGREDYRESGARPVDAGQELAEAPRPTVFVHGGQVVATAERAALSTVLGSCVSVCLYDPVARVGGMNHFLLPCAAGREATPRFGDVAMPRLLEQVLNAGGRREGLHAQVFGGACVLEAFRSGRQSLGDDNAVLALGFLEAAHIPVERTDVGGTRGRKLVFLVDLAATTLKLL